MTEARKKKISTFAEIVANNFSSGNKTELANIAEFEELFIHYDKYENAFDGMLVSDADDFHIHINTDLGNSEGSKKGRFTLAHELGHFFIDEHRIDLKSGKLQPHASFHGNTQKETIEIEADYFAGCLLFPERKFQTRAGGKKFSLDTILDLSDSFQASVLSTVIRFAEVGTHEVTAVVSSHNNARWYVQSKDFPKWPFRFKVGSKLPPTTVSGEFFTKKNSKYTGIEKVSADDWFYPKDARGNRQMYEQCYYSDSFGYVISLLWFD